jgi:hypothetical protein
MVGHARAFAERRDLKTCKRCNSLFAIGTRRAADFCSPKCQSAFATAKYHAKQKAVKPLHPGSGWVNEKGELVHSVNQAALDKLIETVGDDPETLAKFGIVLPKKEK